MKKLFSHMFLVSMIAYSSNVEAMLRSKVTSLAPSKISTSARRTVSSHPKYKSDNSLKTYFIDGAKGVVGGSLGAGVGYIAGGTAGIITALIIAPPCHLTGIQVSVESIESCTCPVGIGTGGLIGSAVAGGVTGVAGYGLFLATAYAVGKYKSKNNAPKEISKK